MDRNEADVNDEDVRWLLDQMNDMNTAQAPTNLPNAANATNRTNPPVQDYVLFDIPINLPNRNAATAPRTTPTTGITSNTTERIYLTAVIDRFQPRTRTRTHQPTTEKSGVTGKVHNYVTFVVTAMLVALLSVMFLALATLAVLTFPKLLHTSLKFIYKITKLRDTTDSMASKMIEVGLQHTVSLCLITAVLGFLYAILQG